MLTAAVRRTPSAVALVFAVVLALVASGSAANADPNDEGQPPSVRDALDIASRDYSDAKGRLDASKQRQATLAEDIKTSDLKVKLLTSEAGTIASTAYRTGKANLTTALLSTDSPDSFLHNATTVRYLAMRNDRKLRDLKAARKAHAEQESTLASEIKSQEEQVSTMEKKKKAAEEALKKAGGGQLSAGVVPGAATAKPSPRNANGSWPSESCSEKDPTTSGCLTPRTLHALQEARLAGYTWYTACYRTGDNYDHPKGRACDFASAPKGFQDVAATGDNKLYGDKVAGWLLANANALGLSYIIWYNQIWMPSTGWRSYGGGSSPAGGHYNHVHMSVL